MLQIWSKIPLTQNLSNTPELLNYKFIKQHMKLRKQKYKSWITF